MNVRYGNRRIFVNMCFFERDVLISFFLHSACKTFPDFEKNSSFQKEAKNSPISGYHGGAYDVDEIVGYDRERDEL